MFITIGENFVTRKVSRSVAQIYLGHRESVSIYNSIPQMIDSEFILLCLVHSWEFGCQEGLGTC